MILPPPKLIQGYFLKSFQDKLIDELRVMRYRPCPPFLGRFDYSQYKTPRGFSETLQNAVGSLAALVPNQTFNTFFVQRYTDGAYVKRHRDPKNNIGVTIIAVFGDFTGARSHHGSFTYQAKSGDVIIQNCTVDGVQGEYHFVEPIQGERYCVILNSILS